MRGLLTRPPWGPWLGGLLAGAALVAVVTGVVALLEPHLPVLSLLVLYLLAILPVAVLWGSGPAAVASILSTVLFGYLFLQPERSWWLAEARNSVALAVFLITAVVVANLAARLRRAAQDSARLTQEQAALRRVATLVAEGVQPSTVFEAVTREVGTLCGADLARMERYDDDGAVTGVAAWSRVPVQLAVGTRIDLDGVSIARQVRQTNRPVRVNSFERASGSIATEARALGIRSSIGCPIIVDGNLWGVIAASTKGEEPFHAGTESQIARFTELVATTITNAEARTRLRTIADEQAALRRVATVAAQGAEPDRVFALVAEEVRVLMGADATAILRFEADGTMTYLGVQGRRHPRKPGARWSPEPSPPAAVEMVRQTGRSARLDYSAGVTDKLPAVFQEEGFRCAVASPIVVNGRLWGTIGLASRRGPLPVDTEQRLIAFTEIVATAIANMDSRSQLAASRARVIAAADATRRQLERDLHDGAQQRLVSLALELRNAQEEVPGHLPGLRANLDRVAQDLTEVLDELRELSRGIHPAVLSEGGLGPALRTLARRSGVPTDVDIRTPSRFPDSVEVAAYYVVSEALTNATKHAGASHAEVIVAERNDSLRLSVRDDGVGGADPNRGSGLTGLRDRVEALGGSIDVSSPVGEGTLIDVSLPRKPS